MEWKRVKSLDSFNNRSISVNVIEYKDEDLQTKLIEILQDGHRVVLGEHDLREMLKELTECS